jgi:CheY-like chemotaxis protein
VIDDNEKIHADFRKILGPTSDSAGLDSAEAALFGEPEALTPSRSYFRVDCVGQGQEGLERVRAALRQSQPYCVAFVDMRMPPGWDGVETIDRLWREDADLQSVICTAHSDYSLDQIVARLGQSDRLLILKKPFEVIEVRQMASALALKWSLGRELRARLADLQREGREPRPPSLR